jgi:formamidopyrimidine-DNA glycosylase
MPELPEVETITGQLRKQYLGKRIAVVDARPARIYQNVTPDAFAEALTGNKLEKISRHGKRMIWQLDDVFPIFHLGMSGIFIGDRKQSNYPQHIHVAFTFDDGDTLFFQDVRKFGKIWLFRGTPVLEGVGEDVLSEKFTLNKFKKLLHLRNISIKNLLMDQQMMAGIGNIYANEILFDAWVHPERKSAGLTDREMHRIFQSMKKILELAIERFGTTYKAYLTVDGNPGENQNFLKVYQREGQNCVVCENVIEKYVLNSRSTFYCPKCQK